MLREPCSALSGKLVLAALVPLCTFVLFARPALGQDGRGSRPEDEFLRQLNEQLNDVPTTYVPWAIFLGAGNTPDDARALARLAEQGKLMNPITGTPFREPAIIFAQGWSNPVLEAARLVTEHVEIHALAAGELPHGYHIGVGIFHSNGSTYGLDAQRTGDIHVDNLLFLGADRTSFPLRPGELHGANAYFFVMRGDPVWRLPAPHLMPVGDGGVGLGWSIPFNRPSEIPAALGNLVARGRAEVDGYPVVVLDPPAGHAASIGSPFGAHALFESYGVAIPAWLKGDDPAAGVLRRRIETAPVPVARRDDRSLWLPPGGGPGQPGAGLGLGPGGKVGGEPGHLPAVPVKDDRGGVHAEVEVDDADFAQTREVKP